MTDAHVAGPDLDFSGGSLPKWIQPQHLAPSAIAQLRARFTGRPERFIHIDDFLIPDRVSAIRQVLLADGVLEPAYKVFGKPGWTDAADFNNAPDAQRFISEMIYRGPKPGREMAPGVLTDLMFRGELRSDAFRAWLAAVTGRPIRRSGNINLKLLNRSDVLRWHSDKVAGRTLCMVLYLHADWPAGGGGRFLMRRFDGGVDAVEPIGNRLVLFDPQVETEHAVEDMAPVTGGHARMNYSAWFYDQPSA